MIGTARSAALRIAFISAFTAWGDADIVSAQGLPGFDTSGVEPAAATPEATQFVEELAVTKAPVVGGKESAPCGWPSTVDISGCTGTLIHPRVVTSAAHCLVGRSSASIKFMAGKDMPGSFTVMGQCKTGGFFGGQGADWAYCVIPEDPRVKMMQITPPLVGCEAERFLKPGNSAWIVGFGETGANKGDNGIKREVEVKINKVSNGTVDVGDKDVGACHGDSGGPLYIKLTDGTHDWGWRTAGSTSGAGSNCDCCTTTVFVDMRQHVKAIEENEDIDVTPCTDDQGKWQPGPDCKDFITDPASGTGTYPMCAAPVTREPIATCGDPSPSAGAAGASAGQAAAAGRGAAGSGSLAAGTGGAAAPGVPGSTGAAGAVAAAAGSSAAGASARAPGQEQRPAQGQAGAGATSTGVQVTSGAAQRGGAGALGTGLNAATAAGAPALGASPGTPMEDKRSGCQIASVGVAGGSGAFWAFGAVLTALSLSTLRRRQRQQRKLSLLATQLPQLR